MGVPHLFVCLPRVLRCLTKTYRHRERQHLLVVFFVKYTKYIKQWLVVLVLSMPQKKTDWIELAAGLCVSNLSKRYSAAVP